MSKQQTNQLAVIRRPLLPESMLHSVNRALSKDPATLEAQMIRMMKSKLFQEAIYLASPQLYQLGQNLVEGKSVAAKKKVLVALYKYLIRACTRSTPFGLFAGYITARLAETTRVSFNGRIKKHSTLSSDVLEQISLKVKDRCQDLECVELRLNSSLYECPSAYRYTLRISASRENPTGLAFRQIEHNEYLKIVIGRCNPTASGQSVLNALISSGLNQKAARALIQTLIDQHILSPDPERPLSLQTYQKQLAAKAMAGPVKDVFSAFSLLQKKAGHGAGRFAKLEQALQKAEITMKSPVQIDAEFTTTHCGLSKGAVSGIINEVSRLLQTDGRSGQGLLPAFVRQFTRRYQTCLMPMMQALDPDLGIGYGELFSFTAQSEVVKDLVKQDRSGHTVTGDFAPWMQKAYFQGIARPTAPYMLSQDDLPNPDRLPKEGHTEGFSILGSIIAESAGDFDKGNYLFELKGIAGPGGAQLLARFADADPHLCSAVNELVKVEQAQYASVIFAEISYVPGGSAGNVTRRPHLNSHQICLLADADSEAIPLDDILVGVQNGQVMLFSKSLQKRILPRLNSAHNFAGGPAVYRFLSQVALQDAPEPFWDGSVPEHYPFFPRVQYGRTVISKAQWNVGKAFLPSIPKGEDTLKGWWKKVRSVLGIPRFVYAGTRDRQLLIDGNCHYAIQILVDMLDAKQIVGLTEALGVGGPGLLTHKDKSYRNEIIIPVLCKTPARPPQAYQNTQHSEQRLMTTNDGWIFFKLYGSENSLQQLLTSKLLPLVDHLEKKGLIQKWFFLRYQDPDTHIRLRLYSPDMPRLSARISKRLHKLIASELSSGAVHRLQTQVYERETSRYHLLSYQQIESIFFVDSKSVARLLTEQGPTLPMERQWLTAVIATDQLLDAFGYSLENKFTLCFRVSGSPGSSRIDPLYRKHKAAIASAMQNREEHALPPSAVAALVHRKNAIKAVFANHELSASEPVDIFIHDLIHLFCNRYFITDQQAHERIVYHFLKKYYDYRLNLEKVSSTDFVSNQM